MFAYNGIVNKYTLMNLKTEQTELSKKIMSVVDDTRTLRKDLNVMKEENERLSNAYLELKLIRETLLKETEMLQGELLLVKDSRNRLSTYTSHNRCTWTLTLLLCCFVGAFIMDIVLKKQH